MSEINWTSDQRAAITELGRSVVVSAAAGSGKTAVLAERCAHLVCDAPPPLRCGIDRLLVVTFAEDAAAEMKDRIRANFQKRLRDDPRDPYLREQSALLETARISTMHAFCNWIIRRWFNKVDIDPAAPLLPDDELRILKTATLDRLFDRLYQDDAPTAERFRNLVDVYGLGNDDSIRKTVLRLANYLDSLPDPDGWLAHAAERLTGDANPLERYVIEPLRRELGIQLSSAEQDACTVNSGNPFDVYYGGKIAELSVALTSWREQLEGGGPPADRIEMLQRQMAGFELTARKGLPKASKDDANELAEKEAAKRVFDAARKRFQGRLRDRFALFTPEETLEGLRSIRPVVAALADITAAFREDFQSAKHRLGVIDFADQERLAYRLLDDPQVVAALRDRFDHILVDEYQDISPLQDALLRRVSREDTPESVANLFTVGDVKQSIYGFRSAEPDVFRDRIDRCNKSPDRSHTIHLLQNYRSQPHILRAVNLLFSCLMRRAVGDIDYDENHALHPGRPESQNNAPPTVDVHLLDLEGPAARPDSGDDDSDIRHAPPMRVNPDDASEWETIEREAYVIGAEIQQLIAGGMTVGDGRPLELGDIAILLRSASHTADRLATFLGRMGITAQSNAGAIARQTTELNDVRALLQVIDNTHQDIPLAAVLRSTVLGQPLNEDDLLAIRNLDREVPFHDTVRRYPNEGDNPNLRERVRRIRDHLTDLRRAARRQPVADLVRRILHDTGYLAYVVGLTDGDRRRRNLLWFHQRARRFGDFRNQGLRRFIAHLDALDATDQGLGAAPHPADATGAVQIMTMHKCKGLEFPVVFVADLGRKFNLTDKSGRIIFDRHGGIGPRVVDPERMIEYPSAAHQLVAASIDRRTRAEELRLLYVAMTRAREKLYLLGRTRLDDIESRSEASPSVTPLDIESARAPVDWLIRALASISPEQVTWSADPDALFRIRKHPAAEMSGWRIHRPAPREVTRLHRIVAALDELPPDEPRPTDPEPAERTLDRLSFVYPHLPTCAIRAVVAASEIKSPYNTLGDPDERQNAQPPAPVMRPPSDRVDARQRGTATHLLLQHLNFATATDPASAGTELTRMVAAGLLPENDASLVDLEAIAWFISTPLGQSIRDAGSHYHREFMFVAAQPAHWFDSDLDPAAGERVLVRGVVDAVLDAREHTEVIDFKTDIVTGSDVAARADRYAGQLNLYAAAIKPIFQKPVARSWLVFLHPRQIVPMPIQ